MWKAVRGQTAAGRYTLVTRPKQPGASARVPCGWLFCGVAPWGGAASLQQRQVSIDPGGAYQEPLLAMLVQGSAGGNASPACSSSMEMPSGERTNAMRPSRGGRLIVTPWAIKALQVS